MFCAEISPLFARTVDPGSFWVAGAVGPMSKFGGRLGGSDGFFALNIQGEYCVSTEWSAIADLDWGIAASMPLRAKIGAKYRVTGLNGPISPYAVAQLSVGTLFNTLGANLGIWALGIGIGADYFLTAKFAAGLALNLDIGSTQAESTAFYGFTQMLARASYAF